MIEDMLERTDTRTQTYKRVLPYERRKFW